MGPKKQFLPQLLDFKTELQFFFSFRFSDLLRRPTTTRVSSHGNGTPPHHHIITIITTRRHPTTSLTLSISTITAVISVIRGSCLLPALLRRHGRITNTITRRSRWRRGHPRAITRITIGDISINQLILCRTSLKVSDSLRKFRPEHFALNITQPLTYIFQWIFVSLLLNFF